MSKGIPACWFDSGIEQRGEKRSASGREHLLCDPWIQFDRNGATSRTCSSKENCTQWNAVSLCHIMNGDISASKNARITEPFLTLQTSLKIKGAKITLKSDDSGGSQILQGCPPPAICPIDGG